MPEIRVVVVDDHAILRDGICSLLERQDDILVVAEAENGRQALDRVAELLPDIVLMDIAMPEMSGLEATRRIHELYPQVKVLILTQHDDSEYIEPLLRAGASGYVPKRAGGHEVLVAIREVFEHGAYLEPGIAHQVIQGYTGSRQPGETAPLMGASLLRQPATGTGVKLTVREEQVLRLISTGKSNKEIALLMGISPKTVSVHRSNLMAKLGLSNSLELLRYATQHNL
jgi:two-component system response regulator NreC